MPEASDLAVLGNASVVAPAGHGKTELIARVAALGQRALVLTHTHAGVHAIRARLKRMGVPRHKAAVDTIAGWAMRYGHAFPGAARPPSGLPASSEQWNQLYEGARVALSVAAVRQVIAASYDRVLVDEYQDCGARQHELATALSTIVPTMVFGDPMQGIFEFAGATLDWESQIYPAFPLAGILDVPHRWAGKNPELGSWIAETREKLILGDVIDLADSRIAYRESADAFDMAALFNGIDGKDGSFAAIHCNKGICYRLARAAGGGYQAIEEIAAKRLAEFSQTWDRSGDAASRLACVKGLLQDCVLRPAAVEGEPVDAQVAAIAAEMRALAPSLGVGNGAEAAMELLGLARRRPGWKLFRAELWRDAERALGDVAAGLAATMAGATDSLRQRVSNSGRKLPRRTVSTPLLLKGLEFDHVFIPDAEHFAIERQAEAKLFYVAISRATRSLTITSPRRFIQLPRPVRL